jgi:hypothetical protein
MMSLSDLIVFKVTTVHDVLCNARLGGAQSFVFFAAMSQGTSNAMQVVLPLR